MSLSIFKKFLKLNRTVAVFSMVTFYFFNANAVNRIEGNHWIIDEQNSVVNMTGSYTRYVTIEADGVTFNMKGYGLTCSGLNVSNCITIADGADNVTVRGNDTYVYPMGTITCVQNAIVVYGDNAHIDWLQAHYYISGYPIFASGANNITIENTIVRSSTSGDGICVANRSDNAYLWVNQSRYNAANGIYVGSCWDSHTWSNYLEHNAHSGLCLNTLTNTQNQYGNDNISNEINDNTGNGVSIESCGYQYVVFGGNNITNNHGYGLWRTNSWYIGFYGNDYIAGNWLGAKNW